jgi:hypothetical protein
MVGLRRASVLTLLKPGRVVIYFFVADRKPPRSYNGKTARRVV